MIRKCSPYFYVMLLVNLVLMLLPTWKGLEMELKDYTSITIAIANYTNLVASALMLFSLNGHPTSKNNKEIIILLFLFAFLSIIINFQFNSLKTFFVSFVIYFVLFVYIEKLRFNEKIIRIVAWLIILWSIVPLLYFPFASSEQQLWMFSSNADYETGTFCGFGCHRNYYGYFASLSIILLSLFKIKYLNNGIKLFIYLLLFVGLALSSSRSSLLAAIIPLIVFNWKKYNSLFYKIVVILLIAIAFFALSYFGNRFELRYVVDTTSGGRDSLISAFYSIFLSHFFFGTGGNTVIKTAEFPDGTPCHNFIFQTAADYGIFVIVLFLLFIIYNYIKSTPRGRMIWLHLLIIGFFQPYFYFGIPNQFIIISYLLIYIYNRDSRQESCSLQIKRSYDKKLSASSV